MGYAEQLLLSFRRSWGSPALLSVLLLDFIIIVIMSILFLMLDSFVLAYLNRDIIAAANMVEWRLLLNTKTFAALGLLALMQMFIITYVDSFFKAGF